MFRIPKTNMILDIATELYNDGYTNINLLQVVIEYKNLKQY